MEKDFEHNNENCVEWLSGSRFCTGTFTERKAITKMKKIYEERKDEFKKFTENKDGSICCTYPRKWEKQNPGKLPGTPKKQISPEQKAKMIAALEKARKNKKK